MMTVPSHFGLSTFFLSTMYSSLANGASRRMLSTVYINYNFRRCRLPKTIITLLFILFVFSLFFVLLLCPSSSKNLKETRRGWCVLRRPYPVPCREGRRWETMRAAFTVERSAPACPAHRRSITGENKLRESRPIAFLCAAVISLSIMSFFSLLLLLM